MTTAPKITVLAIAEIVMDAGTQIRAEINEMVVAEYAALMEQGEVFPPVEVFFDGSKYFLADGFHRVVAASRIKRECISSHVHTGSRSDALKFALSANAAHGARRTNADKRHSVELALAEWPKLSSRELARICAVSDPLVSEIRQLLTVSSCDEPEARIGADGRKRKVKTKEKAQKRAATPAVEPSEPADGPDIPGTTEPAERPRIHSGPVIDAVDAELALKRLMQWSEGVLVDQMIDRFKARRFFDGLVDCFYRGAEELKRG